VRLGGLVNLTDFCQMQKWSAVAKSEDRFRRDPGDPGDILGMANALTAALRHQMPSMTCDRQVWAPRAEPDSSRADQFCIR